MKKLQKLQGFLKDKFSTCMTAEQEMGYISACAKRILNYERFFLLFIMAFQIYNIVYAFIYTNGRLHTASSRVYTVLYAILLLVSLGCLVLTHHFRKHFPDNPRKVIHFQLSFAIFILVWGACVTVYDQRVSENLSTYLVIALVVAMVVQFTPVQAILTYGTLQLLLFGLLPLLKDPTKDSYGEHVNLTILTLLCVIISVYRYYHSRKQYIYQQIIIEKNSKLKHIAYQDSLTGLRNRRFLENEMNSLYQQCFLEKIPLTFMMLDIDSFKSYNDRFGHLQGDECLRRVTWRIHNTLDEEQEYLIRYGGEEFLYVGIGIDASTAASKGHYFNQIIRDLVIGPSDREPMGITVSIGTYTMTWDETTQHLNWKDCISKADKALYMAKNNGKDQCVCLPDRHAVLSNG